MLQTALSIDNLQDWIQIFQQQNVITGIDCDASLLEAPVTSGLLASLNLNSLHVRNLIPDDPEAILSTAEQQHSLDALFEGLLSIMKKTQAENMVLFSLPFRLDRIEATDFPSHKDRLSPWIAKLLTAPIQTDFSLVLPVSFPKPFPGSRELERALELCTSVNSAPPEKWASMNLLPDFKGKAFKPSLGICANIYAGENAISPQILDPVLPFVKALSFHYNVQAGETLFDDEQEQWAEYLKQNKYDGMVIFTPVQCPTARFAEICDDVSAWAPLYM